MGRRWPQARRSFDPALPELRRRTAWLTAQLDPKSRALVRLMPLLLCARFRRPPLDGDAPGVRLAPRRRRWGKLCAQLDLPPPVAFASARPLVASVVLVPRGDGRFELLVLPVDEVPVSERSRLVSRIEALEALVLRHCPALELRLASRAELPSSYLPWAAVCAGDLPPFSVEPVDRLEVVLRAPTPLARCLALLVDDDAAPPLEVLRADHGPCRPESFAARWGGTATARAALSCQTQPLAELKATGTAFREACVWALRRMPPRQRRPLRALLRRDLFSSFWPAVFRPALELRLRGRPALETKDAAGWTLSVDGVTLAQASTLDQLRASAVAESPLLARDGSPWGKIAQLRAGTGSSQRSVVVIESAPSKHLVVSFTAALRPKARRVELAELLRFALRARLRGAPCEVIASIGSEQTVVNRLAQLSSLSSAPVGALGIEVGDRLLLAEGHRVRMPVLRSAMARPRRLSWLPADPELLRTLRRPTPGPLAMTHVAAYPLGSTRAAVYSLDSGHMVLREEIALVALEAHLIEARELLRRAEPPSLMSVTVHPSLAALAGRRLDSELPVLPVDVDCEWPFTLRVWLEGESFCAPGDLSWTTLAEAILSHWPPGTWGRVGVRRVTFIRPPPFPSPLFTLAVRSRVLRRVSAGLRRLTRVLEAA